jgi:ferric-dicitrate binding protein FerR (iron transport regulator)
VLSGEAYFKVAHNPLQPFVVKAGKLNVTALGTEFNVLAYSSEKNIETTLVNGKVKIEKMGQNGKLQEVRTLDPLQHFTYDRLSGRISNSEGNIEKYISWKDGKLIFKDESIMNIAAKLGRWYNVDFEFADKESMEHTYTATFVDESLYQILDLLSLATPIEYKIPSREKLSNGTYSKQKVIIKSRNYYN